MSANGLEFINVKFFRVYIFAELFVKIITVIHLVRACVCACACVCVCVFVCVCV